MWRSVLERGQRDRRRVWRAGVVAAVVGQPVVAVAGRGYNGTLDGVPVGRGCVVCGRRIAMIDSFG